MDVLYHQSSSASNAPLHAVPKMASTEVTSALKQIEGPEFSAKTTAYNELLSKILANPTNIAPNLVAYLQSLLSDAVGIVASRPLVASFVEQFKTIEDAEVKIEVGQQAIELLRPKVISYEEQDTAVKMILADAYQEQEDYSAAAKMLQKISLDSSQRVVPPNEKASIWIRIVRCYLEEDDPTSATGYLNRIKNVLHEVTDKTTRVMFQLSQARIFDSQRNFLDASAAYYSLSLEDTAVDEDERLQALSAAITCAVLAPAGPQRAKTLARLYKDDRAGQTEDFSILEKIFLNRLLSPDEVKAFAAKLAPHQLAKTADGSTVLDKAVLEHNLLAASRLYSNIGFSQLGVLLGIDAIRAEDYAAQMIEQGRLAGYIDQIDELIYFEGEGSGERKVGHAEGQVGKELRKWDANVQGLAEEVEKVASLIQLQCPVSGYRPPRCHSVSATYACLGILRS